MRRLIWIILPLFLLASCKRRTHIPRDILPEASMQKLLWDLTRADLFNADFRFRKDSTLDRKAESIKTYQEIFLLHNTNKEQFEKSFTFYKAHPKLLKVVVDSLDRRLNGSPSGLARPENILDTHARAMQRRLAHKDSLRFNKKPVDKKALDK